MSDESSATALPDKRSPWRVKALTWASVLALLLATFLIGRCTSPGHEKGGGDAAAAPPGARIKWWTCSMHPQIRLPDNTSKCPLCFMDLIPVYEGSEAEGETGRLVMSERAKALARIETAEVRREPVTHEVRLVGKVTYDERKLFNVSAWIPGRVDRLYVDFTGIRVRKGEHLVYIYSPELRTAQEEYLLAYARFEKALASGNEREQASARTFHEASRRKLELWGILPEQIAQLQKGGTTSDRMTIHAPIGGTVVGKEVFEGKYVTTGERLYTIADLDTVWVVLDAYELDMAYVRYGQSVKFETEAWPGETFEGRITFIEPTLNEMTRTVKVRLNVDNSGERLKPGMFVRATIEARLTSAGHAFEPALAGKFVCPMHIEIVEDEPGTCSICGMDLVPAEAVGLAGSEEQVAEALVIPATAPLLTGTRAVVFVEVPSADGAAYEGRVVELGPKVGDRYVVRNGLAEGERVVTRGNFKIDASLQILGKPSMLNPPEEAPSGPKEAKKPPLGVEGAAYHEEMAPVIQAVLDFSAALAADDGPGGKDALGRLRLSLESVPGTGIPEAHRSHFASILSQIREAASSKDGEELDALRERLTPITAATGQFLDAFGAGKDVAFREAFCPMARDGEGGSWYQAGEIVANPYYGASMLRCGEIRKTYRKP